MKWALDSAHTSVEFSVRHLAIATVHGRFDQHEGFLEFDGTRLVGAEMTIATNSLSTRDDGRDAHLRSGDFFEVENHPTITFSTEKVDTQGHDLHITGNLTIKGVTQPVSLKGEITDVIKDPWGGTRVGLTAEGRIQRKNWGLVWNVLMEAGALLVGEDVKITIETEAVQPAPDAPSA